jgi:uncharacterized DUF497 family protein
VDEPQFEWDPYKEATNLAKHGIDFVDASEVFDDPQYLEEESTRHEAGEVRLKGIGTALGKVYAVIFTYRQDRRRIISARRVRPDEQRRYDQGSSTR